MSDTMSNPLRRQPTLLCAVLGVLIMACTCGRTVPPLESLADLEAGDLAGIWQAKYTSHRGTEVLVLREEGTYLQIYTDSDGYLYASDPNHWRLVHEENGRVFVVLEWGRWFSEGPDTAEWLVSEGGDDLRLEVAPSRNARGVELRIPVMDPDSGGEQYEPIDPGR